VRGWDGGGVGQGFLGGGGIVNLYSDKGELQTPIILYSATCTCSKIREIYSSKFVQQNHVEIS